MVLGGDAGAVGGPADGLDCSSLAVEGIVLAWWTMRNTLWLVLMARRSSTGDEAVLHTRYVCSITWLGETPVVASHTRTVPSSEDLECRAAEVDADPEVVGLHGDLPRSADSTGPWPVRTWSR